MQSTEQKIFEEEKNHNEKEEEEEEEFERISISTPTSLISPFSKKSEIENSNSKKKEISTTTTTTAVVAATSPSTEIATSTSTSWFWSWSSWISSPFNKFFSISSSLFSSSSSTTSTETSASILVPQTPTLKISSSSSSPSHSDLSQYLLYANLCNLVYVSDPQCMMDAFERDCRFAGFVRDLDARCDRYAVLKRQPDEDPEGTQFVVIRGTDNFRNVILDVNFRQKHTEELGGVLFHQGFYKVAQLIEHDLDHLSNLDATMTTFNPTIVSSSNNNTCCKKGPIESPPLSSSQTHLPPKPNDSDVAHTVHSSRGVDEPAMSKKHPVVVIGHSLGGACALMLALHLSLKGFKVKECVTFGQPKITNETCAEKIFNYFSKKHIRLVRIVNSLDPIPLLPPASIPIWSDIKYVQFGPEITLSNPIVAAKAQIKTTTTTSTTSSVAEASKATETAMESATAQLTLQTNNRHIDHELVSNLIEKHCQDADCDIRYDSQQNSTSPAPSSQHSSFLHIPIPTTIVGGIINEMEQVFEELFFVYHRIEMYISGLQHLLQKDEREEEGKAKQQQQL